MRALHKDLEVEIKDADLREAALHFSQIREAFEEHSLLMFRNQYMNEEPHLAFARFFGRIEISERQPENHEVRVSIVSNLREDGHLEDEESPDFCSRGQITLGMPAAHFHLGSLVQYSGCTSDTIIR